MRGLAGESSGVDWAGRERDAQRGRRVIIFFNLATTGGRQGVGSVVQWQQGREEAWPRRSAFAPTMRGFASSFEGVRASVGVSPP